MYAKGFTPGDLVAFNCRDSPKDGDLTNVRISDERLGAIAYELVRDDAEFSTMIEYDMG